MRIVLLISGNMATTKWPVGKNVITLTVNIECCGTKFSEVNEQCEVTVGQEMERVLWGWNWILMG